MGMIDGGRLVAKALKKEGVEQIFTLSGGHITSIYYGCRAEGIEIIDVRHECNEVYAADAFAQVTGKAGVVVSTAGPGVTNTVTGMMEAFTKGIPIIHIGGASFFREDEKGGLQEFDTLGVMSQVSKWARKLVKTERIPEYISMAFREAHNNTPGPVYLEIPADILAQSVEEDTVIYPTYYRTDAQAFGDPALVEQAAELLMHAERPALVVGTGARFTPQHREAIKELVNYLKIPAFAIDTARGLFDSEENILWKLGGAALGKADVVLLLDVNSNFRLAYGAALNPDATVIQVHPEKSKIGFNIPAHIGIVGSATGVAKQLIERIKSTRLAREDHLWLAEIQAMIEPHAHYIQQQLNRNDMPLHPARVASEVSKFLSSEGADWNVVIDGGDSGEWISQVSVAKRPGQVFRTGPMGIIGTGPGFTLGAWIGNRKPVLYFTGDGSFGYYPMEFDTFERFGIPVVCIVANDSAWGMVQLSDADVFPEETSKNGFVGTDLSPLRRYDKMAEAWGGHGELVKNTEDIVPAIQRAIENGKPSIINIEIGMYNMHASTKAYADSFSKYLTTELSLKD